MIGLDTSAVIDLFHGDPHIKEVLDSIEDELAITHLNYLELLFGIDMDDSRHRKEKEYYMDFLSEITLLPLDESSCQKSADLFWILNKKGKTPSKFDVIIGGIFLANGVAKVITRNSKHFEGMPGIKVIPY